MVNICITGITGLIGCKLLEKLSHKKGINVFALGRNLKLKDFGQNINYIEYDLNTSHNERIKEKIIEKVDYIDCLVHLAAYVPKSNLEDDMKKSIQTNFLGTMNLMRCLGGITKKLIFASTLEVYGRPTWLPITEETHTEPLTFYGASKLSTEKYLSIYSSRTNLKLVILRFTSVYGPDDIYERALSNYIRSTIKNENIEIYGDGQDVRDYLYVDDAIKAIMLAIEKDCEGIFNIASGMTYTKKVLAEKIIQLSGKRLNTVFVCPEYKSKSKNINFDISKAKNILLFSPDIDLEEGLMKEIEWYQKKWNK